MQVDVVDLLVYSPAEGIIITVSGRPSARLVPVQPTQWRIWTDVADFGVGVGVSLGPVVVSEADVAPGRPG
jgi:antitoxin (DNA-binding transcriptional repressor) of toxin-antitoxin stability system